MERGLLPSKVEALESKEQLVAACPAPQLKRKTLKASLCSDETKLSPERIAAVGQRRREELDMRGEIDSVADRQPYPTAQVLPPTLRNTIPEPTARPLPVCSTSVVKAILYRYVRSFFG